VAIALPGCGSSSFGGGGGGSDVAKGGPTTGPGGDPLGTVVQGEYNLGPVDWAETVFHNACSPYLPTIEGMDGNLLAGVGNSYGGNGSYCDACIKMTTAMGKSAILRVITYGDVTAPGNVDLSQEAYDALSSGEFPRTMSWELVSCPGTNPIYFQFQTGANVDWTSLWVRNPRIAIQSVQVKSAKHADFSAMDLGSDGTFTDGGGFGSGAFTILVTGVDGSTFSQDFTGFNPGDLIQGSGNL
jgi:hypothetical protein